MYDKKIIIPTTLLMCAGYLLIMYGISKTHTPVVTHKTWYNIHI